MILEIIFQLRTLSMNENKSMPYYVICRLPLPIDAYNPNETTRLPTF